MGVPEIERSLRESGAIAVLPRILRRVIKRHKKLPGIGLDVPHAHSYVLSRDALGAICDESEIGVPLRTLPDAVILLPRDALDGDGAALRTWRALFHATVHREIDRLRASGALSRAA